MKNKSRIIDGIIQRLDNAGELFNSWICNNNMVISWILNSILKEISASVMYSNSAHDIWIDLREILVEKWSTKFSVKA